MKKLILIIVMCSFAIISNAQGIHFEKELSWEQIKAKAKAENKYIFLDIVTTWCSPCIKMSKEVFPQKEVGDFYNEHFISVKVQVDVTKDDDEFVRNWYKDAAAVSNFYGIAVFPTLLFLSPEGKPVHMDIGWKDVKQFLSLGAQALNPEEQYYTKFEEFDQSGENDSIAYKKMAQKALRVYDNENAGKYGDKYLLLQEDLYFTSKY